LGQLGQIKPGQIKPACTMAQASRVGRVEQVGGGNRSAIKRFNLPFHLDLHRTALAVARLACANHDPAFADAIFFNANAFFAIDFDADFMFKHGGNIVGALWVNREPVGQGGAGSGVVHDECHNKGNGARLSLKKSGMAMVIRFFERVRRPQPAMVLADNLPHWHRARRGMGLLDCYPSYFWPI
jgi:hypothetical protein